MSITLNFATGLLMIIGSSAYAGGAKDCEPGTQYDLFSMECVATAPKPAQAAITGVKPDASATMIRSWRSATEKNEKIFSEMDKEGCTFRGGAHKEPDISKIQTIGVMFSDGESKSVIPHEMYCRKENDKFELSPTECQLGYYEFSQTKKQFTYEQRKLVIEAGDSKGAVWSRGTGQKENAVSGLRSRSTDVITSAIETPAAVDANGPGCLLARTAQKFGPSWRGASPSGGTNSGSSGASH